jgi:pyrimidine-specific ribonucleoside hydrolase
LRRIENPVATFIADLVDFYADKRKLSQGTASGAMHDPCAVAAVIDPSLIEFFDMHVAIELRGTYTYGMTVCDHRHLRGSVYGFPQGVGKLRGEQPNAQVGVKIDAQRFFDLFFDTLAMYR